MIRAIAIACLLLTITAWLPGAVFAQAVLEEQDFWERLSLTQADFGRALSASGSERAAIIDEINARWQPVNAVRLESGEQIIIDTSWLQLAPTSDGLAIQTVQDRIVAVQQFQAGPGLSLEGLKGLVDEPQQRPTPRPTPEPSQPRGGINANLDLPPIGGVLQFLFITIAVIIVVAVLFFIARGLRFTSALAPLALDSDDDPQTSGDALERASSSEQVRDYRAAVRYLYLSSLLKLDENGLIRYDPTLTNREHLIQIEDRPQLGALLAPIIDFFDKSWYGFADITEADYQRFRQQVDKLLSLTAERAP